MFKAKPEIALDQNDCGLQTRIRLSAEVTSSSRTYPTRRAWKLRAFIRLPQIFISHHRRV